MSVLLLCTLYSVQCTVWCICIKEVPNMEGAINKKDKDGGRRVSY
jgi:hypothetical protein